MLELVKRRLSGPGELSAKSSQTGPTCQTLPKWVNLKSTKSMKFRPTSNSQFAEVILKQQKTARRRVSSLDLKVNRALIFATRWSSLCFSQASSERDIRVLCCKSLRTHRVVST